MAAVKFGSLSVAGVALAGLLLTVIAAGALSDSEVVPLSGSVSGVNVELYTDPYLSVPCTSLNAGSVAPGGSVTQTVYVKNSGNMAMILSMAVSAWNPSNAGSYLTLTWNRGGYVLGAGGSVVAILTLQAAASTGSLTTFSCNVTITGTQY